MRDVSADAHATEAPAQDAAERVRGNLARWAWPAGWVLAAVAVFFAGLRVAGTLAVTSDGAGNALEAWQMLHGNPLLHGWWVTDVSFYTTELPEYMIVETVAGLRPEVVHICAALTYTLLVLLAALVARGRARGAEGTVRALLGAGIMLAPAPGLTTQVLMVTPDHVGTAVPVLLLMLLLDWAPRRWYTVIAAGVLLVVGLVGDPLMLIVGVVPVVAVCLVRAALARTRRRVLWFELALGCAAVLAVAAADAVNRLVVALGGFGTRSNPTALVPPRVLAGNGPWLVRNILTMFGADVAGARGGLNEAAAIVHLAGVALAAAAVVLGAWWLLRSLAPRAGQGRPADPVADLLVVAIVANIAAYFFIYKIRNEYTAHEIGPVVSLGAALAGRLLGGPLLRARPRLLPALAAGLACYAVLLGAAAAGAQQPPANATVVGWLRGHGLRSGLASYWEASSITVDSGGAITVGSVRPAGKRLSPWRWEQDMRVFNPADHTANFFITVPGDVTPAMASAAFGAPAHVYHYQSFTIMVWDKNLLRELGPPVPDVQA